MADKIINPFVDIPTIPMQSAGSENQGGTFLSDLRELNIGDGGNNVFRANKQGIWLGADKFEDAPFSVSMNGNMIGVSVTLSDYLQIGEAADDINSNSTTINGGKITTNSIDASKIVVNSLVVGTNVLIGSALAQGQAANDINSNTTTINGGKITTNTIDASKIIAGSLVVGTNVLIGSALAAGQAANDINSHTTTINGGKITTNSIDASKIITGSLVVGTNVGIGTAQTAGQVTTIIGNTVTTGYVNALNITTASLDASSIKTGTLNIGTANQPGAIVIASSEKLNAGILRWTGGSKIWEDSNAWMGMRSVGGRFYFYVGNYVEFAVFQQYAQAIFNTGVSCRGEFNVGNTTTAHDARFTGRIKLQASGEDQYMIGYSAQIAFFAYDQFWFYQNGILKAIIDDNFWTAGNIYASGSKYFNIPHPDGSDRRLQYSAQESPDVVLRYRGKAKLNNCGQSIIVPPEHFTLVTEPKGEVTVNLTAMSKEAGLYVDYINKNESVTINGEPNAEFMFEILAIRKGFLNSPVEIDNEKNGIKDKINLAEINLKAEKLKHEARQKEYAKVMA